MKTNWTKEKLDKFSSDIASLYKTGTIHAPVHLSGGNNLAEELIKIFKKVKKSDWVLSSWRPHWHWLLSGRDPEELKKQIVEGHSMSVFNDKFYTSSIVAGIAPIATGIAWAIKRKKSKDKVWCFLGDSAYECGIVKESIRFSMGHNLPITFIIQDNGLSVTTKVQDVWGKGKGNKVYKFKYKRKYNHAGYALNGEKGWVAF